MGLKALNPEKYGALCADVIPKVIENDLEFDRMVRKLEELTFKSNPSPEEVELARLLERLVDSYDRAHYPIPDAPPHELLRFLMEQRGLKQSDLVPILGSRAQVSELVSGKRGISKANARKLAEFFRVSADLFI
jgi:HTH-type transcriptional regulator/antitoxin HigA